MKYLIQFIILFISFNCSNTKDIEKSKELMALGKYSIAKNILKKIIENNIDNIEAMNLLGISYYELKKFRESEEIFSQLIKKNENYKYYYNRGNARIELNKLSESIADYTYALNLNPNEADIYINRGYSYYRNKNYNKALEDFQKASEIETKNYKTFYFMAKTEFLLDKFEIAIYNLEKSITLNPKFTDGYFWLGLAYIQTNKTKEGCLILKKAKELGHINAEEAITANCL